MPIIEFNGEVIEFPDSMSNEDIEKVLSEQMSPQSTQQMTDQQLANVEGGIIPTEQLDLTSNPSAILAISAQKSQTPEAEAQRMQTRQAEIDFRKMREASPEKEFEVPESLVKRDLEGKVLGDPTKKGLSFGEKLEKVIFTEQVANDPNAGFASGFTGGLKSLGGASTLLNRTLGSLFGQGNISDANTKLLKPLADDLKEWAESREAQNATADQMIANLRGALETYENLPEDKRIEIQSQIDEIEESKNSGLLTSATDVIGSIFLDAASDPLIYASIARSAVRGGLKKLGKEATEETIEKQTRKEITKQSNRIGGNIAPVEEMFADAGGGKAIVDRLSKDGIKFKPGGELLVPKRIARENVNKLKELPIKELDFSDAIEATIVPINKKKMLYNALKDNVISEINTKTLVDDIILAKDNSTQINSLLNKAGLKNANKIAGLFSELGDEINGEQARKIITDLNAITQGKNTTAAQKSANKVRRSIDDLLKKAVGEDVPDDALESYISFREGGTGKFALKQGKLKNVLKFKGDATLDDAATLDAYNALVEKAKSEVASGEKGEYFQNLVEIDELIGSNRARQAEDEALSEMMSLNIKGKVTKPTPGADMPKQSSIATAATLGGSNLATITAIKNERAKILSNISKSKYRKAVNEIAKSKKKGAVNKERLRRALSSSEEGRKFLLSELDDSNPLRAFDVFISKGFLTAKQIGEAIGREAVEGLEALAKTNEEKRAAKQIIKATR